VLSELDPRFRDADGNVDQAKYTAYLEAIGEAKAYGERPEEATYADVVVAKFLARRQEEAIVGAEYHCWPHDLPWNRQPWWKWELWKQLWAGQAEGRAQERR
jgi:hypothetical protein